MILLKRMVLLALAVTMFWSANLTAAPYPEMRTQGLIGVGLLLAAAGVHQLARRAENSSRVFSDIVTGFTFLAAGIMTIVLSSQILHELDHCYK